MIKATVRWAPAEWRLLLQEALKEGMSVPLLLRRIVQERYQLPPQVRKPGRPKEARAEAAGEA